MRVGCYEMGRELLVGNERVYMVGRVKEVGLDFMTYKLDHLDQAGFSASRFPIYHSLVVPDPFINFSECRGICCFCRHFPAFIHSIATFTIILLSRLSPILSNLL